MIYSNKYKELIDAGLITKKQNAIYDYKFQTTIRDAPWYEWLDKPSYFECRDEYLVEIDKWIHSTKNNSISGLENFPKRDLIVGTTQVFDELYYTNAVENKRLRIFRGEYGYHRRIYKNIEFLDNEDGSLVDLEENDFIIISNPFCGIGDEHPNLLELLDKAYDLKLYVLIDCSWFGTCTDINFDFTHPGISEVCFSLSKGLGLGHMRSGIRYSKVDNDSIISQQNKMNHLVLVAAQIGIRQMQAISPDFIVDKYYSTYLDMCKKLNFTPTKCPHIAIPNDTEYFKDYINDELYYKVGVRRLVKDEFRK